MREKQDHDDNEEYPNDAVAPVAVAVARATKAAAEAAQQEDHEYDDKYEAKRHGHSLCSRELMILIDRGIYLKWKKA
jgi:hypothetical protein